MGSREEFGRLVDAARRAQGLSRSELARQIGRLPETNRVFDASGVNRILKAGAVDLNEELVDRLVAILGLDEADAYEAANLRPRGFTARDHRHFLVVVATKSSKARLATVHLLRSA